MKYIVIRLSDGKYKSELTANGWAVQKDLAKRYDHPKEITHEMEENWVRKSNYTILGEAA